MLPQVHFQRYHEFKEALAQVQETALEANLDKAALQARVLEVQQFFQDKILSLPMDELDPEDVSRVQSYQTEIHKQQRLLGNDVMFLRSARQPETLQQRLCGVRDRIQTLIRYCDAVLGANSEG